MHDRRSGSMSPSVAAIIAVSGGLGYALPAIIGLESLGVPSPGETALLLAATLAGEHKLQIWLVIVIAIASAMMGDNIAYGLGRLLGRDVLEAPGPLQGYRKKLIRVGDGFFAKHGSRTVFIGRWITVVRSVVAWLAGINDMPFWEFFLYNALGAITWATAYGLLGFYGGTEVLKIVKDVGLVAAIVIAVALAVAWLLWERRKRTHPTSDAPQASGTAGTGRTDQSLSKPSDSELMQ